MDKQKPTVLYFNHDEGVMAGTSYSLLDMIASLEGKVHPIVVCKKEDFIYRQIKERGIECYACDFSRVDYYHKWYLRALFLIPKLLRDKERDDKCVRTLYGLFKDRGIDIVHSNSSVYTVGARLARKLGAKHVWHVREHLTADFHTPPVLGMHYLRWKILRSAAVIAISRSVMTHWRMDKCPNAHLVGDAVRSKKDVQYIEGKDSYFLFCSAELSFNKGVGTAVKAFALSGLSEKGYRLRLVGNYTQDMRSQLEKLACGASLEFIGFDKNVKAQMSHAKAFLMCSEHEGLGRVTVEAMFYGCPVIAYKAGGTMDIIKDGETGYFFQTVDECAALMREVAVADSRELAMKAQRYVMENFSTEVYGDRIMEIYRKVLSGKTPK